jgi:four helix bundle suffix protein
VKPDEPLIPKHGGYRKLKSFQLAQLVYDVTVRFCDRYIDRRSRTHDQMVQAARSGVQNIAEGSQASGTSKKMELKLTNVARASLEELRLDYEDFLRQRDLPQWAPDHPALKRFKARRCATLDDVRAWVEEERAGERGQRRTRTNTDKHGPTTGAESSVPVGDSPCESVPVGGNPSESVPVGGSPWESASSAVLVANAALSLLNLCCYLLDRQLKAQATAFETEGGFTERLYRKRQQRKQGR